MRLLQTYSGKEDWAFWIKEGDPVWYLQSSFAEKDLAKSAGFSWHGKKGDDGVWTGKKVWFTGDRDKAAKMADYADQLSEWGKDLVKRKVELTTSLSGSRQSVSYAEIPKPEGLEYYPFQKAGVEYMMQRPNTLLGDDMGLGKTIQVLGLINIDTTIKKVLVICPATLKTNWKREMERWFVRDMGKIGIAGKKVIPLPKDGYNIVITNYETVGKINSKLTETEWDLLVVDEAHMLKNQKTIRYMSVMGGSKGERVWTRIAAKRKVFTTGTPICNRPSELWPLISAVDPEHWNQKTFWFYHKRYCNAQRGRYGYDMKGAADETKLNELQIKLRETCLIRRLKGDVLTELPPKIRQVVELEYDEDDQDIIAVLKAEADMESRMDDAESAEDIARAELAKASGDDEYRAAISKLAQRGSIAFEEMARVRHDTAVAKLPYAIEYIQEQLETVGKAIVFYHHKDVGNAFYKEFNGYARIHGSERNGVRKLDSIRKGSEQEPENNDVEMSLFVRSDKTSYTPISIRGEPEKLFKVPGDEPTIAQENKSRGIQNVGCCEGESEKGKTSIQYNNRGYNNTKNMSIVGNSNTCKFTQEALVKPERSDLRQNRPNEGLREGECLGGKLESERIEKECYDGRDGENGNWFESKDSPAIIIDGDEPLTRRQASIDRFQTDENCKLALVSIMAGGVGITLTAASHVYFIELDWVPGNVTQAEDRAHRIGQKDVVNVYHLVLRDSLDVKMAKTIISKQKIIEATLDKIMEQEIVVPTKERAATQSASRKQIAEEAEKITDAEVEEIHEKLKALAAMDRDHARCINGRGFNKIDGYMGHQLAEVMFLSKKQAVIGKKIVRKYSGQIGKLSTVGMH